MSLAAPPIPFLPARRVVSRGHHGRQRTSCAFTSRTDTRSEVSSPPVFLTLVAMRTGSPRTRRASSSSRSGTAGPIGHTLPVLNAGRSHGCRAPARAWCLASPVGHVCKSAIGPVVAGVQYLPSGLARGRIQADFALVPAGMRPAVDGVRTAVSRPGPALPNRAAALRDLSCAGRQPAGGGGPAPLRRARVPDIPAAQPTRLGCGQLSVHHRFLTGPSATARTSARRRSVSSGARHPIRTPMDTQDVGALISVCCAGGARSLRPWAGGRGRPVGAGSELLAGVPLTTPANSSYRLRIVRPLECVIISH